MLPSIYSFSKLLHHPYVLGTRHQIDKGPPCFLEPGAAEGILTDQTLGSTTCAPQLLFLSH